MKNRKFLVFILSVMCLVPFSGFLLENLPGIRGTSHGTLVFRTRLLLAVSENTTTKPRPLRARLRPLLELAGQLDTAFVWDEPAGRIILGNASWPDVKECWNRMPLDHSMHETTSWVCGRQANTRWAVQKSVSHSSFLPGWWGATSFMPVLALLFFWLDLQNRNRQNRQLAERARELAQGQIPRMTTKGDVSEAFAVMAASLREEEERLATNLSIIETQNREILENRARIVEQEKLASIGHLAGGLAHELGNPLAALFSHVELLLDTTVEPEQLKRHLTLMNREISRMDELIRALLQLAREGKVTTESQRVGQAIEEALDILAGRDLLCGVEIENGVDSTILDIHVPVDLKMILVNLFLNAGHAMGGQGKLRVLATLEETELVMDILDSGPGVPAGQEERIFEPFFTTRDPGEGTGLGLSVSRILATQAGGNLICVPDETGGHFRITIQIS